MRNLHILLVLLLAFGFSLLISGCVNSSPDLHQPTPTSGEPAPEHSTTEEPPATSSADINERRPISTLPGGLERVPTVEAPPVVGEVPEELLGEILSDLVERTGVEREAIEVVRAEAVVWNDSSLGCPKPGEFYIQVMISGYWVVLEMAGAKYDYRVSGTGDFKLCEGTNLPIQLTPVMLIAPHGKPKGDRTREP